MRTNHSNQVATFHCSATRGANHRATRGSIIHDTAHFRSVLARGLICLGLIFAGWMLPFNLVSADEASSDYQLGPGDLLHVAVFDHDELTTDARVSQSGKITIPLVGPLSVAGVTARDAEVLIATQLITGHYLKQPQVLISVTDYQSQKVSVMGQVAKPGQYVLTKSQRVLDVLAQAGGVSNDAAADDATLMNKDGRSSIIDLRKLFAGDLTANVVLHDGDTLVIPRSPQFYIYGEVQHPGVYRLERNMTLTQAVAAGGGLTERGTVRSVTIKRIDASGSEQKLSWHQARHLRSADVIIIKQSLF